MELEQQIQTLLERELPGATAEIDRDPDTHMVGGHVIWDGFSGYDSLKRQNRIFRLLRQNLDAVQARVNISYIFTYTPAEYEQLKAA